MPERRPNARSSPFLVGLVLVTAITPVHAQRDLSRYPDYIFPICLGDLAFITIPRIFVGCQLPDCCPRCAAMRSVDWRIVVDGPVQEFSLQFDHLVSPADLSLEGTAHWSDETTLVLGPGESTIRGLPNATGDRVASAGLQVRFDTAAASRQLVHAITLAGTGPPRADARIIIEQLVRGVVVNERVILFRLRHCPLRFIPPTDRIRLDNNTGSDNAVVFLSARRNSGCVIDEIIRGVGLFNVGSVLSNQSCRSEVAVFSDDDAVQLIENVTVWTDQLGDKLPIDLTPDRWQAPVDVWITLDALQTRSHDEMGKADALLNTNHAGIDVLSQATFKPLLGTADAATINSFAGNGWLTGMCSNLGVITGNPATFTAKRINVYYVNQPFTGFRCPTTNVILIGTKAETETLAHEFGHAFSLSHVNEKDYDSDGVVDFPGTNIMMAEASARTTFTEGQCFRMTLNPSSMLNVNGVRTSGPTRTCPDNALPPGSPGCPWIALDAFPN